MSKDQGQVPIVPLPCPSTCLLRRLSAKLRFACRQPELRSGERQAQDEEEKLR
jgi:hypothetical protein